MNLSLIKLQIVEELYHYKKITAVAERLNLKQPTVTFHLKSLEKELGVKLFESRLGKILLTEAGNSLYHYAVKINALAQEAIRVTQEYDLGRGTLKIGASYVPATYLLPNVLTEFTKQNSKISISLTVKTAPTVLKMLENHEIDLAVISIESIDLPFLNAESLYEDELVFFFSPHHPLALHSSLAPYMLNGIPFILHGEESSTRRMTLKWFNSNNIILNAQMELDSLEAIKQIVLCGESVSVISRLAIRKEIEQGKLTYRQFPQNIFRRYIYSAYNVDRKQSSLLDNFIEYLKAMTKAAN